MKMKINLQGAEFKHTPKIKVKKLCNGLVHFQTFLHNSNSEWYSVVCMPPMCLYVCLIILGHAPNKTVDGSLGDLPPDLDQVIVEFLDSLKRNLMKFLILTSPL